MARFSFYTQKSRSVDGIVYFGGKSARFKGPLTGPLTGHPVSVIQSSLPPTAACVSERADSNRDFPLAMELVWVFWKYG